MTCLSHFGMVLSLCLILSLGYSISKELDGKGVNVKSEGEWTTSPWGPCVVLNTSQSCGVGRKTRPVHCRRDGKQVQEIMCQDANRPSIEMDCYVRCNLFDAYMKWYVYPWKECHRLQPHHLNKNLIGLPPKDFPGNFGMALRNVTCATRIKNDLNDTLVFVKVDENECMELGTKPVTEQYCNPPDAQNCIVSGFEEWSWCIAKNETDGAEQYRYRHVLVAPQNGGEPCPELIEKRFCTNSSKPKVEKNLAPYRLKMGEWEPCKAALSIWSSNETLNLTDTREIRQGASITVDDYGSVEEPFDRSLVYQPVLGDQRRFMECLDRTGKVVDIDSCFLKPPEHVRMCVVDVDCGFTEPTGWTLTEQGCRSPNRTWPSVYHRSRIIFRLPEGKGKPCPPQREAKYMVDGLQQCSDLFEVRRGPWSNCSIPSDLGGYSLVECGGGITTRKKACLLKGTMKPVSMSYCSRFSNETSLEIKNCNVDCKRDCEMGRWSEWSRCQHPSCDLLEVPQDEKGYQTRYRRIAKKATGGGAECDHVAEVAECRLNRCFEWITLPWKRCSLPLGATCGHGVKNRYVFCQDLNENTIQNEFCNETEKPETQIDCYIPCSYDCVYSEWGAWTTCSHICIPGSPPTRNRIRYIIGLPSEGVNCTENLIDVEDCPKNMCEKRYSWLTSGWGECVASNHSISRSVRHHKHHLSTYTSHKNRGTMTRRVVCTDVSSNLPDHDLIVNAVHHVNGNLCAQLEEPIHHSACYLKSEKEELCTMTEWSEWSPCPTDCDWEESGTMLVSQRTRLITGNKACSQEMFAREVETRPCKPAQTRCRTYKWMTSPWSPCQLTQNLRCGTGYRTRGVYCVLNGKKNVVEPGWCLFSYNWAPQLIKPCFVDCNTSCAQSQWSFWTECSAWRCESSFSSFRQSQPLLTFFIGNNQVMTNEDLKMCNESKAPLCQKVRINEECSPLLETRECGCRRYQERIDEEWSPCIIHNATAIVSNGIPDDSSVCGVGLRYRRQLCFDYENVLSHPSNCGSVDLIGEELCDVPCPVDCVLTEWSNWGPCEELYIIGTQQRHRKILVEPSNGGRICGQLTNWRSCRRECSQFPQIPSRFNDCKSAVLVNSSSGIMCGSSGQNFNSGRCYDTEKDVDSQFVADEMCVISMPEIGHNCTGACPGQCIYSSWTPWSQCRPKCQGISERSREVLRQDFDGLCNETYEQIHCNQSDHCHFYNWKLTSWSSCVVNGGELGCGKGIQTRLAVCKREDDKPEPDSYCQQPLSQRVKLQQECEIECPIDCRFTDWSEWNTSDCNSDDIMADQHRYRTILVGNNCFGRHCLGGLIEHKPCPLEIDYKWVITDWSSCLLNGTTCGHGVQTRRVNCYHGDILVSPRHCMRSNNQQKMSWRESLDLVDTEINSGDAWRLSLETEMSCFVSCDRDCVMTSWSPWSLCHRKCNLSIMAVLNPSLRGWEEGYQTRSRVIVSLSKPGGEKCPKELLQTRPCLTRDCITYQWAEHHGKMVCKRTDGVVVDGACPGPIGCPGCHLAENGVCSCPSNGCKPLNGSCQNELHIFSGGAKSVADDTWMWKIFSITMTVAASLGIAM